MNLVTVELDVENFVGENPDYVPDNHDADYVIDCVSHLRVQLIFFE
jgi:hypothetical protein